MYRPIPNRLTGPSEARSPARLAALAGLVALAGALFGAAPVAAQQGAPADTLARRVAELEARLDSLEALLIRVRVGTRADTTSPGATEEADLERLRRAADAAAEEAAGEADSAAGTGTSRTRNLQMLNPEISVTGDVVGTYVEPSGGPGEAGFVPREFEIAFQSALDPYARTKIFLAREQEFEIAGLEDALSGASPDFLEATGEDHGDGVQLEEGYLYWVGLPAGLGLKLGHFRQEIGRYNRWHTHALYEVERPLAAMYFLGEDGLIQTGASLSFPSLTTGAGTQTLTLEATAADNRTLFEEGNGLSWLGHLESFWDLGPDSYLALGATGLLGHNDAVAPGVDLDTRLLALDATFRWTPAGRELYRDLRLTTELYLAEKDFGSPDLTGRGGYVQGVYRLGRQWVVGARADWLDGYGDGPQHFQLAPHVTWWQSEWVRLRLQYDWLKTDGRPADHTLLFQTVWATGPHKHESY